MAALWMKKLAKTLFLCADIDPNQGTELGKRRGDWITASLGHWPTSLAQWTTCATVHEGPAKPK